MGIATVTAARILAGQQRGATGEENLLSFEELPYTAFSKTYTVDFQVGESAGTITALMTGVKTRSGVLGVDESAARGDFAATAAASRADPARARRGRGQVDRRRDDHHDHARDAGRLLRAHAGTELGVGREALARGARRRLSRHRAPARRVRARRRASRSRSAAGARTSCRRAGRWRAARRPRPDGRVAEALRRRAATSRRARQLLALDPTKARHALGLFAPSHLEFESVRAREGADRSRRSRR